MPQDIAEGSTQGDQDATHQNPRWRNQLVLPIRPEPANHRNQPRRRQIRHEPASRTPALLLTRLLVFSNPANIYKTATGFAQWPSRFPSWKNYPTFSNLTPSPRTTDNTEPTPNSKTSPDNSSNNAAARSPISALSPQEAAADFLKASRCPSNTS